MKRIVVAVINDLSFDQRMIRTCETLQASGYDVIFVGRELPDSMALENLDFTQVRLGCKYLKGPQFYAEYNLKLRNFLKSIQYDLAVACDLDTILAVSIVSKARKTPYIYDAHEYFTEVPELQGRTAVKGVWEFIARRCIPGTSARFTVGPMLAQILEERYGVPFDVVRNVPEVEETDALPFESRDPVILYQGALNMGRGLEAAIDTMTLIEGLELHLAGEGDLSQELRNRVVEQKLQDKVKFLGKLTPSVLKQATRKSLIGLNLLENKGLSYYYSLSNKFFDYMQAGTPSINMTFPEYMNILADHRVGLAISELSIEAISDAIRSLRDESNWNDYAYKREAAETFSWTTDRSVLLDTVGRVLHQS